MRRQIAFRLLLIPFLTALLTGCGRGGEPTAGTLRPVDEAAQDASFLQFRQDLLAAIERRDAAYLVDVLAPEIVSSFGAEPDPRAFIEQWNPAARSSAVWEELATVLGMGGSFRELGDGRRQFCAPYVYSAWPDDLDAYNLAAITGRDVPVRAAGSPDAEELARLSHAIVRTSFATDPVDWVPVVLEDGRAGYVAAGQIRSPLDYRACFEQLDGEWRMTAFVAGD